MSSLKSIMLILIGIIIGLITFILINANNSFKIKENPVPSTPQHSSLPTLKSDSTYRTYVKDNYKIFSIPLPENPDFAGEIVPIQKIDVHENLDREMLVNTYWHSNTFLLHKRAARWFPIIEPILAKNNIPDDFKYLAVIESGLDNVTSPSGAKGFWQFMKPTGKSYNLEINEYVDERFHIEKSTQAACEYLQSAYNKFNNWTLAAASYNMGKTGLQKNLDIQKANNYYDLLLNTETGRYLYRIVATKYILSNSNEYGFNIREADLYTPNKTINIAIKTPINDLVDFALAHQTNYKIIKLLNPWIIKKKLPNPKGKTYILKVPDEESSLTPINP